MDNQYFYTLNPAAKIGKFMDFYTARLGYEDKKLRFELNGKRIKDGQTANEVSIASKTISISKEADNGEYTAEDGRCRYH